MERAPVHKGSSPWQPPTQNILSLPFLLKLKLPSPAQTVPLPGPPGWSPGLSRAARSPGMRARNGIWNLNKLGSSRPQTLGEPRDPAERLRLSWKTETIIIILASDTVSRMRMRGPLWRHSVAGHPAPGKCGFCTCYPSTCLHAVGHISAGSPPGSLGLRGLPALALLPKTQFPGPADQL